MRIGIDLLSEKGAPGGIHTYVNELLARLAELGTSKHGPALKLLVFAHRDYTFDFDTNRHPAIEVHRTRWRRLPAAARRAFEHARLPALARLHGVDVVHSINNVLPAGLPVPGVVTVHDLSPFVVPGRFGRLKSRYLRNQVPASVARASRVICISRATADDIVRYVPGAPRDRMRVVPLAVAGVFSPEPAPAVDGEVRRRFELPERFLLHVGLVEPAKNLATVSRALALLRSQGEAPPLVVAGPPTPYVDTLRRLWREIGISDQVRYLGTVPASVLPSLYRLAEALVFTSLCEGFGLPLLEAFASGCPAVTSNGSALAEVAGKAALLVPPDDAGALAAAIRRLWRHEELRALLRLRGLERAQAYSWDDTALRTLDVYREVVGTPISAAAIAGHRVRA